MNFLDLLESTASKVDSSLLTEAKENIVFINKTSNLLFDLADVDRLAIEVNGTPGYKTIKDIVNDKENTFVVFNDSSVNFNRQIQVYKLNKQTRTFERVMYLKIDSFIDRVRQGEMFEKADKDLKKYFKEGYKALKGILEDPDKYFTESIIKKLNANIVKKPNGDLDEVRFSTSFAEYYLFPGDKYKFGTIDVKEPLHGIAGLYTFLNNNMEDVKEIIEVSKKAKDVDFKGLLVSYDHNQILSQVLSKYAKDIDTNYVLGRIDNNSISNSLVEKFSSLGIEANIGAPSLVKKGSNLIYSLSFKLK